MGFCFSYIFLFLMMILYFFFPQHFLMDVFNIKKKLKGFYSEHLYIYPLGSAVNINTCFITYIYIYISINVSFYPSVNFDAFQSKLQASIHLPLHTSACILSEFGICLQFWVFFR